MTIQSFVAAVSGVLMFAATALPASAEWSFEEPGAEIRSMSTLEFGPDGVLFVGDSQSGAVFALDTGDTEPADRSEWFAIADIETRIAALLGCGPGDVMIHDMSVNPVSRAVYFAVSRERGVWESRWQLPNDLTDASVLLRLGLDDTITDVDWRRLPFARVELPNPVDADKTHMWKEGLSLRVDTITDLVVAEDRLYVSGLSNEEFAATLWHLPVPFSGDPEWGTLEIFHGAHGEWETFAPIRSFLTYEFAGEPYVLASYLCTPLVTFPLDRIRDGEHVKGHTVAEFGSGNYPLDLVNVTFEDRSFFVMANSQLPLMTFSPQDVQEGLAEPGITRETPGYTEGVPYTARAGSGIQQLDVYNDRFLVALQRMPNGRLDLNALSVERLAQ